MIFSNHTADDGLDMKRGMWEVTKGTPLVRILHEEVTIAYLITEASRILRSSYVNGPVYNSKVLDPKLNQINLVSVLKTLRVHAF
jgi:hypothetical protein